MADLYVNGVAMSTLNWWLEMSDAGRTNQPTFIQSGMWSRRGTMVAGVRAFAPRTITLTGAMVTAANTVQGRVTAEDTLNNWLGGGLVSIRLDDGTTPAREIDGLLTGLEFERVGHPLLSVKSTVKASLLCPDGDWRATNGTAIGFTTSKAIPLGTAPSAPIIRIAGSASSPQLLYQSSGGATIHQLTFTGLTLGANDWLDVDCARGAIQKSVSGTVSSAVSTLELSAGSTFPFALDPADGDYANSVWPTLRVTAGNGEVLYTKMYR